MRCPSSELWGFVIFSRLLSCSVLLYTTFIQQTDVRSLEPPRTVCTRQHIIELRLWVWPRYMGRDLQSFFSGEIIIWEISLENILFKIFQSSELDTVRQVKHQRRTRKTSVSCVPWLREREVNVPPKEQQEFYFLKRGRNMKCTIAHWTQQREVDENTKNTCGLILSHPFILHFYHQHHSCILSPTQQCTNSHTRKQEEPQCTQRDFTYTAQQQQHPYKKFVLMNDQVLLMQPLTLARLTLAIIHWPVNLKTVIMTPAYFNWFHPSLHINPLLECRSFALALFLGSCTWPILHCYSDCRRFSLITSQDTQDTLRLDTLLW